MHPSLKKELAQGKYERTDSGFFLPKSNVLVGGYFDVEHVRDGEVIHTQSCKNMVVNEGLNHILNVTFTGSPTPVSPWYVAIFESDTTIASTMTYATPVYTESTAYTEANRPTYVEAVASQQCTNSASKATFSINATKTIYGASLVSVTTKGDTAGGGVLMAASKFSAARSVVNTDSLLITYTISASDA